MLPDDPFPYDSMSRRPLLELVAPPTVPAVLSDRVKQQIEKFVSDAMNFSQMSAQGLAVPRRLILHGPTGTGKSHVAAHIASQLNLYLYRIRLDSIVSCHAGETEKNVQKIFEFVSSYGGALEVDGLDALARDRRNTEQVSGLLTNAVLQGLDSLDPSVVVIATTNLPSLLDPASLGRFHYNVEISLPDHEMCKSLWELYIYGNTANRYEAEVLSLISKGFSGARIRKIGSDIKAFLDQSREFPPLANMFQAVVDARNDRQYVLEDRCLDRQVSAKLKEVLRNEANLSDNQIRSIFGSD